MKILFVLIAICIFVIILRATRSKKPHVPEIVPDKEHQLLNAHVRFYQRLSSDDQSVFRRRIQHFFDTVAITAVGDLVITDLDRLYVAASAIIPIYSFTDWAYNNLNEVLIYPQAFTKDFKGSEEERNVLGMVGDGAMHRMMILSIQSLRSGFEQDESSNTGIHEFVHLLDKADGATDGIPEAMIPKDLIDPWIKYMHSEINEIRAGQSDINPYAATNETEFFAVVSEYFFQKPEALRENHPELMTLLENIYRTKTV